MRSIVFACLLYALTGIPAYAQAAVSAPQRDALVALYNSTDGPNWTEKTNWLSGDPCGNNWYGVTCNTGGTAVTSLDLADNHLSGSIPPNWAT